LNVPRRIAICLTVPALLLAATALAQSAATAPEGIVPGAESSYSMGLTFGEQLKTAGVADRLSVDALLQGLKAGMAGTPTTNADKERVSQLVQAAREGVVTRNRAAASEFLVKNGKEPGVQATASGLQYKVLTAGDPSAPSPKVTDQVTVNYSGRLLNGTEFDSSYTRGQPATFSVGGLIKGWTEALQLMKPGAKWQVFVPPDLGYGANSPGGGIPPGSLLVFDLELLNVKSAAAPVGKSPPAKAPGIAPGAKAAAK
jgi:FKBP-type peptidyl-prolyl cis-trans isomerase